MLEGESSDPAVRELLQRSEELRQKALHLQEEFDKLSGKIKRLEEAAAKALGRPADVQSQDAGT